MVHKEHCDLMKSIKVYVQYLIDGNFAVNDFFIPRTYKDSTEKTLPHYMITKIDCEFIANKMIGVKGALFTAAYVTCC